MPLATEQIIINFGPQHPSTHGVFRMRVKLDGEVVIDLEPILGYLHRGIEKLVESKTYLQVVPFTDRQDYLAAMTNNLAYALAVEKLCGIEVPRRAQYIRVIMAELMRIASHLIAIGCFLNDCGTAFTPFLYMFREREKILDLFEMVCGQRMTFSYIRPGGVSQDLPPEFLPALKKFLKEMPSFIDEYDGLISENEVFLARTKGVGILPPDLAINSSASGPVLRASGIKWDIRKADPYLVYHEFDFEIPVGKVGDCFDRYWVRMQEMRQSIRILNQAVEGIPEGDFSVKIPLALRPPKGEVYSRIESPRGELGVYLVSDGGTSPYRYHVRSPALINLTALKEMCVGWKIADLIIIFGSIDVVLGEIDR